MKTALATLQWACILRKTNSNKAYISIPTDFNDWNLKFYITVW